jgi:hypothetical protein
MGIDEPKKPPVEPIDDHVAMTYERTQNGWKATAQTEAGELSATGASIAEAKAALKVLIRNRIDPAASR